MEKQFSASSPLPARVVERREDGSALVEVPILTVQAEVDFSKTEGGGAKDGKVEASWLLDIVANFPKWPRPVSIGFDGVNAGHGRDKAGPQLGFVRSVRAEGGTLYAVAELTPQVAQLIGTSGAYRATSVEALKSPTLPTGKFNGWVLTGFTFTNTNAIDTVFEIAATGPEVTADKAFRSVVQFTAPTEAARGEDMADEKAKAPASTGTKREDEVSLAERQRNEFIVQLNAEKEQTADLRQKLSTERVKSEGLQVQLSTAEGTLQARTAETAQLKQRVADLESANTKLNAQVTEQSEVKLAAEIKSLAAVCIGRGFTAAFFEGCDKDPVAWFKAKGFADISALQAMADSLPEEGERKATTSGRAKSTDGDEAEITLSDEDKDRLEGIGVDLSYADVKNARDLTRRKNKEDK